jgi:hypothetical protein
MPPDADEDEREKERRELFGISESEDISTRDPMSDDDDTEDDEVKKVKKRSIESELDYEDDGRAVSMRRETWRKEMKAPPGLVFTRDVNPDYDRKNFPR